MSTAFDLKMAKQTTSPRSEERSRRAYDERIFMRVESYSLSRDGSDDWVVGSSITNPEQKISVRLSTLEERMADLPQANPSRLKQSYEGENSRDSLAKKAKNNIELIAFDGARPVGVGNDGVRYYRAHWPQTMSNSADAEVMQGIGTIRLYQPNEGSGQKANAYVELLRNATPVDASNVAEAISSALAIKDENGNSRDGHAQLRITYQEDADSEPILAATTNVFPFRELKTIEDPLYKDKKTVRVRVEPDQSMAMLQEGAKTGLDGTDRSNDLARVVLSALAGDAEPPVTNVMTPAEVENFRSAFEQGQLSVEVLKVERIPFGVDTAKTYLRERNAQKFASFVVQDEESNRPVQAYGNVVLAVQRYASNGQPYAVYASPEENVPKVSPLNDFDSRMPLTAFLPEDPHAHSKARELDEDYGLGM